ncbi:alpha/beta hydrolase [Sphingobium sp. AN558]|uniref:alpha/beta fold hydrolase n=1 Tax=Sphingobium sp. AN558 TaxID=3133442 RepID=UPI0030C195CB
MLYALAPMIGRRPPAPAWFEEAVAMPFQRPACEWEGAALELLCWGEVGRPGLLLLSGNNAHAHWWSPIAARLSETYRVAALSWSGMGMSGWRTSYSIANYAQEAMAAARAADLFAGGPPVLVAHSFGGGPALEAGCAHGEVLAGAIILDSLLAPDGGKPVLPVRNTHRIYATQAEALARFRLAPPQTCDNLFYMDWVARHALCEVEEDGTAGWRWCIDPSLWEKLHWHDKWHALTHARCPLAIIRGEESCLVTGEQFEIVQAHTPAETLFETIPGAGHHVMLDQPLAVIDLIDRMATQLRGLTVGKSAPPGNNDGTIG